MTNIQQQLDQILTSIEVLNLKVDCLNSSVQTLNNKVSEINFNLSNKCDKIKEKLKTKVDNSELDKLQNKITILESHIIDLEALHSDHDSKLNFLKNQSDKLCEETENEKICNKAHSKRFNLLIHGIPENRKNAWESRDATFKIFQNFLLEGLN